MIIELSKIIIFAITRMVLTNDNDNDDDDDDDDDDEKFLQLWNMFWQIKVHWIWELTMLLVILK